MITMHKTLRAAAVALLACTAVAPAHAAGSVSQIVSNFNGTAIAAGRYIWFNSVFSYGGPTGSAITIHLRNSHITFTANAVSYDLPVPDADITFSPFATMATTTYDSGTNRWITTAPFGLPGNTFLSGLAFQAPVDLPGGINPVTWSGEFSDGQDLPCISWKWGAGVYTSFSSDHAALGVKPVDDNSASQYLNSDHAGTPEAFKASVTGGARGGGGSNFTGSYSGTATVCDLPSPVEPTSWGAMKSLYR